MAMTSRERVQRAVGFQAPDRVPIDLGGMKASGIAVEAYARLRQHLGLAGRPKVLDARFMIAHVEDDVRRRLHVDVVPLDLSTTAALARPESAWIPRRLFSGAEALFPPGTQIGEEPDGSWVMLDEHGCPTVFRMPKNGYYFDDVQFDRGDGVDPAKFRPPDQLPDDLLATLGTQARALHEGTEYALLGWGGGVCFLGMSLITDRPANVTQGQPSAWMMMLMTEKETCHEMMGRSVDASIRCLAQVHQAVGDRCVAWGIAADDSGTQRREFIRPELWAEMIKPHYRRLCDWIHAHTRWKTFLHCCGSVYHLVPHFIEAGVDILNPVQISAANMEPERLARAFGGKIVFWGGGCDTQHILPNGTPAEIREHVRRNLDAFQWQRGGYVFNPVHNIQRNVPAENIEAVFAAAYEFGGGAGGSPGSKV